MWKQHIRNASVLLEAIPDVGVLQCTRIVPVEILTSKQIDAILIRKKDSTPTAKKTYNIKFTDLSAANWIQIYLLPRKITNDAYARVFQYKILNNILYLNKKPFSFWLI